MQDGPKDIGLHPTPTRGVQTSTHLLLVAVGLQAAFTVALQLVQRPPGGRSEGRGGLGGVQGSAGNFMGLSRKAHTLMVED